MKTTAKDITAKKLGSNAKDLKKEVVKTVNANKVMRDKVIKALMDAYDNGNLNICFKCCQEDNSFIDNDVIVISDEDSDEEEDYSSDLENDIPNTAGKKTISKFDDDIYGWHARNYQAPDIKQYWKKKKFIKYE